MRFISREAFLKSAGKLPPKIRIKLRDALKLLQENPRHPLLHVKKLSGELSGLLSFRITREWRIIFYHEDSETICLVDVANRKDIYK